MLESELEALVAGLRRVGRDDVGLEVKRASTDKLPSETVQTLCAFANTPGGGALILGLDEADGFAATGCAHPGKLAADIAGLCRDALHPPLLPTISQPTFEGVRLVVAEVAELDPGDKPCHLPTMGQANGSYIRVADGNHRLTQYEVAQLLANRSQPAFDAQPVEEATRDDLDGDLVHDFVRQVRRSRPTLARRDEEDLLRRFAVLVRSRADSERWVPSLAGLLALGRDPQSFPPLRGCSVAVTVYPTPRKGMPGPGGERFIDDKVLEGPVPTLLDHAFAVLLTRMSRRGMVSGLGRVDRWEYPLEALREILVNAVAHRDYSPTARGTRVQVEMYPDRLEVLSPGGLFGPVSVDQLGEDGVASARNRVLVDILENVSFPRDGRALCEGRATGIPTVIASLRDAGLVPAEFTDRIKDFRVTLPNRPLLDVATHGWLDGLGQPGLTTTQRMALALLRTGRTLTSDQYRVEFAVDSKVARAELADLIGRGLVRMVNQRRWARYVLDEHAAAPPERQAAPDRAATAAPRHAGPGKSAIPGSASNAERVGAGAGAAGRETEPGVADTQELVLAALAGGPLSRREISERVGVPDRRVLYAIRKLVQVGSVTPTGPARSPHATYRLASADDSAG